MYSAYNTTVNRLHVCYVYWTQSRCDGQIYKCVIQSVHFGKVSVTLGLACECRYHSHNAAAGRSTVVLSRSEGEESIPNYATQTKLNFAQFWWRRSGRGKDLSVETSTIFTCQSLYACFPPTHGGGSWLADVRTSFEPTQLAASAAFVVYSSSCRCSRQQHHGWRQRSVDFRRSQSARQHSDIAVYIDRTLPMQSTSSPVRAYLYITDSRHHGRWQFRSDSSGERRHPRASAAGSRRIIVSADAGNGNQIATRSLARPPSLSARPLPSALASPATLVRS